MCLLGKRCLLLEGEVLNLVITDISSFPDNCKYLFIDDFYGFQVGGVLRKAGGKYFREHYLRDVVRSSLFLAVNGGGFVVNVCLLRFVHQAG